eukprot:scaffold18857_cov134-Isochrysis_galbana.AAC.1
MLVHGVSGKASPSGVSMAGVVRKLRKPVSSDDACARGVWKSVAVAAGRAPALRIAGACSWRCVEGGALYVARCVVVVGLRLRAPRR